MVECLPAPQCTRARRQGGWSDGLNANGGFVLRKDTIFQCPLAIQPFNI
jgi:hypothetical protein